MPSGPNVTMRSGATSAMWSATVSVPSRSWHAPSSNPISAKLVDAERGQALAQLVRDEACRRHAGGKRLGSLVPWSPSVAVTHDHSLSLLPRVGHEPCRQVGLVVGVCPNPEQRPLALHLGTLTSTRGSSSVIASTSSANADVRIESRWAISS